VEILDLDLCGTEQVCFCAARMKLAGGIKVTASHKPPEYNGLNSCGRAPGPLSATPAFWRLRPWPWTATSQHLSGHRAPVEPTEVCEAYLAHLFSYVDLPSLKPLRGLPDIILQPQA
jgi:phosphomannomutase